MATSRDGRLYREAQQFLEALEAKETRVADEMARAWAQVLQRVQIDVDLLIRKLEAARLAGTAISPAWLYQEQRLTGLLDTIGAETRRWAPYAEQLTASLAQEALDDALRDAQGLTRLALTEAGAGITATFAAINPNVLAHIVAHLAPGGPLRLLLLGYGAEAASAAQAALLEGITTGKGSDWIARQLRRSLDVPRWRAETLARTEALRAYREASRASYAASRVVQTWTWFAALDRRTCPACVAMHGSVHPLEETLDGHPRCRCAMVPNLTSVRQVESGEEWLRRQGDLTQRGMLGPGKFDAWKGGRITMDDMVARTYSPEWGTMRRERSLLEITQRRNPNYGALVS